MPDYERMYHILCRAVSEALDKLPDMMKYREGRNILQLALQEAEELYIREDEEDEEK